MCYHRLTRPWIVYIFVVRSSVQTFSGLVSEVASPPRSLHPPSMVVGICPLVFFTRWIPNTLSFLQKIEDSSLFLRVPLLNYDVNFFSERGSEVAGFFHCLLRKSYRVFSSVWSTDHIIGVSSYIRVAISLCSSLEGFYRLFLVPKDSLFSRGSKILREIAPRLQAMSWEVFSLTYFSSFGDK